MRSHDGRDQASGLKDGVAVTMGTHNGGDVMNLLCDFSNDTYLDEFKRIDQSVHGK